MDHLIKGDPEAHRRHGTKPPEWRRRRRFHDDLLPEQRDCAQSTSIGFPPVKIRTTLIGGEKKMLALE